MANKFATTIKLSKVGSRKAGAKKKPSDFATVGGGGHSGARQNFASWKGFGDKSHGGSKRVNIITRIAGNKGTAKRKQFLKFFYTGSAIFALVFVMLVLFGLAQLQQITASLPDPQTPFDNPAYKSEASVMYDRSGQELYRLFADNRDSIRLAEGQTFDDVVPPQLKWSLLAAEDITFYEHPGFDLTGIIACGFRYLQTRSVQCGGSTITQQVAQNLALGKETTFTRKIKDIILAAQMENVRTKDEILLTYFNLISQGGNVYGFKTGARYYFDKDLSQLTLAESTILASLPNNPNVLSPTRSTKPDVGKDLLKQRQEFIFGQLIKHKDKINYEVKKYYEAKAAKEGRELTEEEKKDFITEEVVEEARNQELVYREPREDIKAPHFVFFAQDLLTSRPYNNGIVFTENELKRGGYRIYTTLDYEMQKTALDVVQNVAQGNSYGKKYGARNSAMMTMMPRTGEILTMVGSKCYNDAEMANCTALDQSEGKLFDPQVNILATQQQPGSSIKPVVYYEAYRQGKLAPSSQMADIPIEIGSYDPKNSDGKFIGINSARVMLGESRNIPAISALMSYGPSRLAEVKKELGYTINVDPASYGPSSALGANDVYAFEHAAAYATFANGGSYVPYEAILKIEDRDGNVVFDLNGKDKPEAKQVLDEKAVFLTNDSTNPKGATGSSSPVKWKDNRDMSGKTGTSENNRDNWFVLYSPDFVTLGWSGNNDNTPMGRQAFGSTNVEPWVRNFMEKVGNSEYFKARTAYRRPGGIATGRICGKLEVNGSTQEVCEGNSDFYIDGLVPPVYISKQVVDVCADQQDRLARDIDKATGNAIQKEFSYMKMPADSLQPYLDKWLQSKQGGNGAPTEQCNINRSTNGDNPWAMIMSPTSGSSYTGTISVNVNAFSNGGTVNKIEFFLGSTKIGESANSSFLGNLSIPSGTISGTYEFIAKVFDTSGKSGSNAVNIKISGVNPTLSITAPGAGGSKPLGVPINVVAEYSPALANLVLVITRPDGGTDEVNMNEGASSATATFTPLTVGSYKLKVRSVSPAVESATVTINVAS